MHMYFCESESTLSYMTATRQYIDKHGKPVAFYTDKHGVFRVNHASNTDQNKLTQYGRALKELNIELICAKPAKRQQNVHRPAYETQDELYDIFSWLLTRQVSKSLTLQYDRVKYMLSNTPDNKHLVGKNVMIYDYPDGNIDIKLLGKSLELPLSTTLKSSDKVKL